MLLIKKIKNLTSFTFRKNNHENVFDDILER